MAEDRLGKDAAILGADSLQLKQEWDRGADTQARAFESMAEELVQTQDMLVDVVDRLIALEARVKALDGKDID